MHGPNMEELIKQFKITAETRACIVLNGMGKNPPTEADFMQAAMSCVLSDTYVGHSENADWRLFIVALPEGFDDDHLPPEPTAAIHLPRWMVDTVQTFVTDEELDTIIGETPCRNWVNGITALAESLPAGLRNEGTIELCRTLEAAGATLTDEKAAWIDSCLRLKVAAVREARKEPHEEPEADTVVVAIIGQ